MATTADIRRRVYEYAYGAAPKDRPFTSTLNEALDNSETAVDVADGSDWTKNDILEVVETGEQLSVVSISTDTLTVIRGAGAVSATSASDGGAIRKNPRFTQDQVDNAIKDCLNAFSASGIHGFGTGSITLVASQYYYALADTDIDPNYGVLACYYPDTTTEEPVLLPFRYVEGFSTSPTEWDDAGGVKLLSKGDRATTGTVYYTYAQSYQYDIDLATTLAKIAPEQEELIVDGAVARLFGLTILPATQDPGVRTDRTIQPGQTSRDGRWFQGEFYLKSRMESARLAMVRKRLTDTGSARTNRVGRWRP